MLKLKILFIGQVWPEPDTTAAGTRMMQLIKFFEEQQCEIHFASTASHSDYSYPLDKLGVTEHEIKINNSGFDSWIKELNPAIVVFDRFNTEEQFSWRVKENCSQALRILDSEDLHCLREARRLDLIKHNVEGKPNEDGNYHDFLINKITLRELSSIYRSDLTLIISEFEIQLLKNYFKISEDLLLYLPFMINPLSITDQENTPGFSSRKDFMSIGNWKHQPNLDAFRFLKEIIWPKIRAEMPEARLHIYGAYGLEQEMHRKEESNGFIVEGWIPNKEEAFLKHRICLAPLRYGAGLKGKLLDAMYYGMPSVTSSIGAEGMHGSIPWPGSIEDRPEDFSKKAVGLYRNEKKWRASQLNGFKIVESKFQKKKFNQILNDRLSYTLENIERIRAANLIGALLWQNQMLSTKYLSKWIEAKNSSKF